MKNTFLKSIVGMTLTMLLLASGANASAFAEDDERSNQVQADRAQDHNRTLVGVWVNQVTVRNCDTGAPLASFQTQTTFAKGGTYLETVAPSIFRSYGNGLWKRKHGWNQYSLTQRFMRYDATGAFIGSGVVTATITLDETGDNYTSTATNDLLDLNGNVIASGCATTAATRFSPE